MATKPSFEIAKARTALAEIIAAAIRRKNIVTGDPGFQPVADAVSRPAVVQEVLDAIEQAGWTLLPPRKKARRAPRSADLGHSHLQARSKRA